MHNVIEIFPEIICRVKLGMTKDCLFEHLGFQYKVFKRTSQSANKIFAFDIHSVHIEINDMDIVEVISIFRPNAVTLYGVQILGAETLSVFESLNDHSDRIRKINVGLLCPELGILMVDVNGIVDGVEFHKST